MRRHRRLAHLAHALVVASLGVTIPAPAQCPIQPLDPTGQSTIGEYGYDVDTDGVTMIVGARGDDLVGTDSGSAKVFERAADAWVEVITLAPADGQNMDMFGRSVAVDGQWIAVGSPFDDDTGNASGTVYLYRRVAGTWTFITKLSPFTLAPQDNFGYAVALQGDRLVVGAPGDDDRGSESGSVFVYEFNGSAWIEQPKLIADDGSSGDEFGTALDLDGDRILIGAPLDDDRGIDSGSAYIFELSESRQWVQAAKLTSLNSMTGDHFAADVSLDGDTAVIGATRHNIPANDAGAVFIFQTNGRSWSQSLRLTSATAATGDHFGQAVAIDGNRLLVGARLDDDYGVNSGALFLYIGSSANWTLKDSLFVDEVDDGDYLGWSVALSGDIGVVSALAGAVSSGGLTGAAYAFNVGDACYCPADIADSDGATPDGEVNIFDLLALLANWGTAGVGANIADPTNVVDVFDLLDVLSAWGDC